jgi:hypothetical protein
MRKYSGSGARELFDILETNKSEVERLMRTIKGFASYTLVRTDDGGYSLSVYADRTGSDESVRVARDWVAKNAASAGAGAPVVTEGTVVLNAT